jgi:hypothetical protein
MVELPTDIDVIARNPDGALRNLLITQRYHDLSLALAETISSTNVNWSTFASWASKTAGQSIRNEEVPKFVVEIVADADDDVMHPFGRIGAAVHSIIPTSGFHVSFLLAPISETLGTVSTSIAAGNLKVYAELAPQFVRFVQTFRGNAAPTDAQLADWIAPLNPAPATEPGGQALLRTAFTAYVEAIRAKDPIEQARFALLGNCLIGQHEQTRLQPQIAEAMDAPIDDVLKKHLHLSLGTAATGGIFDQLVTVVEEPLGMLTDVVQDMWERIATRYLMSLALPGGAALPLGRNIPKDAAAQDYLPIALQNITAPSDLMALLTMYDRARGVSDIGSASVDWRLLDDRMNFIVNLFRSRQDDDELFVQPFNDAQRAAFEAGTMPDPSLGPL